MSQIRRYRKRASILAEQIPPGETRQIETLEGPAIATGPDWVVEANTGRRESWIVSDDFFTSLYGYEETGEITEGRKVYRKKQAAEVLSYVVETDDHEAVAMYGMAGAFRPPRGYRIVTQLDGSERRAVEPAGFDEDFEPADA